MSTAVVADTHTLIWHFERSPKLSTPAHTAIIQAALAGEPVYVPSISIIELAYLVEKGKLPEIAYTRLVDALLDTGTAFKIAPLDGVI
jgi:PIN domain nuclease of toxin-antitoxin system